MKKNELIASLSMVLAAASVPAYAAQCRVDLKE